MKKDKRGTWPQAIFTLILPILIVLILRWALIEPYVIPSGSMIPTLLIHDHILVNKLAYGLHLPFSKRWLMQWGHPEKGDVVVFRYPEKPELFYVKRVVATAGDELELIRGRLHINGQEIPVGPLSSDDEKRLTALAAYETGYEYFIEQGRTIRYRDPQSAIFNKITVPAGRFFVMGDNRDESYDSRFWGFVEEDSLIGRASYIWLACESTLDSAPAICNPSKLRTSRMLLHIQ